MPRLQRRPFAESKDVRRFPHGELRTAALDDVMVGEFRLEPGWRWSKDVRPMAGTNECQHHHMGVVLEGQLHVEMADGTSIDVIAGDAYEIPPGHDAWVVGDQALYSIEFTGSRTFALAPGSVGGGVVATLLFTDIVESTATLARVGDARWRSMLLDHNAALRGELDRHRGRELKTTGDGFLAVFDSASRAVRCALAMVEAARKVGLEIRAGCHTGEIVLVEGDAHGVAVHAAARVMSLAGASQVFASWTTRDSARRVGHRRGVGRTPRPQGTRRRPGSVPRARPTMTTLLLLSCIARVPHVTPEVLAVAGAPPEHEAELAASRETFVTVCSDCHLVPAPRWHARDEWRDVVEKMRVEHDAEFDDAQRERLLAYIDLVIAWDAQTRAARDAKRGGNP